MFFPGGCAIPHSKAPATDGQVGNHQGAGKRLTCRPSGQCLQVALPFFIEKQEEIKMTYEEALDNVYGRLVFGIKPGLERITALMERLGNPQKKLKFVHVAGTNGKGTCATLVASALGACGLRVGLYTSPYVLEFRERFQIDGEMIPKEELVEITLQDDVLKVDGNMAIAWSGSLNFTVERSGKSLVGSAASGEGLVNVYRGTGRVLLAPVLNGAV